MVAGCLEAADDGGKDNTIIKTLFDYTRKAL